MKQPLFPVRGGFTLVETMVAAGVFMVVSAAILTGVVSLQRNFSNSSDYAENHATQLRISDYLSRDLRQALSFAQTGTGNALVMTMTVPNYYDSTGTPRSPVVNTDATVSYQDASVSPPKKTSTIRYYIQGDSIFREVDGAAKQIAEGIADFVVIPLDSAVDPNAGTDFNLTGLNAKVAEVKVQVNFRSHFGSKTVSQTFYNTTLMRNARTDTQTNLY
jgi:type II secretory pathway component PulJ